MDIVNDIVFCVYINKAPIFLNELYIIVVLFIFLITFNYLLNYLKFEWCGINLMFEYEIQIQIWFEFNHAT
jgi:hypothetical protein